MVVVGRSWTAAEAEAEDPGPAAARVAVFDALEGGAGIEVCRRIRSIDQSIRCLILAEDHDEQVCRGGVLAGAFGYLLKQPFGRTSPRQSAVPPPTRCSSQGGPIRCPEAYEEQARFGPCRAATARTSGGEDLGSLLMLPLPGG